jgi:predicted NBD/HSP70 family sugar kinase
MMSSVPGESGLAGLRSRNRDRILSALGNTPLSRAGLARATGLSKTTVATIVAELTDRGLVEPMPSRADDRGVGRPGTLLRLTLPPGVVIGVGFAHSKVRAVIADLSGTVLREAATDIDVDRSASKALDTAAFLVSDLLEEAPGAGIPTLAVAMGVPGPVAKGTGLVQSSSILPSWADLDPGRELEQRLGTPVTLDNEANLAAVGEMAFGAGRGIKDAVYLKISTGIGAGLVLNGSVYRGASGIAGEIGHVQVREDGAVCRCGSRGCLETVVSMTYLIDVLQPAHAEPLTVDSVISLIRSGDSGAIRVSNDMGRTVGRALADLCNSLNPAAVIVGSDISSADGPLIAGIRDSIARYTQPNVVASLRVMSGALGERAAVLGAVRTAITTWQSTMSPPGEAAGRQTSA